MIATFSNLHDYGARCSSWYDQYTLTLNSSNLTYRAALEYQDRKKYEEAVHEGQWRIKAMSNHEIQIILDGIELTFDTFENQLVVDDLHHNFFKSWNFLQLERASEPLTSFWKRAMQKNKKQIENTVKFTDVTFQFLV